RLRGPSSGAARLFGRVIGPPPNLVFAPLAFASALALTPLLGRIAEGTGYLDHPDLRKHHAHPMPLLGGVAIGLSIVSARSEEHTSELQSRLHLVCRLLLE